LGEISLSQTKGKELPAHYRPPGLKESQERRRGN
jgi:hypothetical protein